MRYNHIGYRKWEGGYIHLFYSLGKFQHYDEMKNEEIEYPASLLIVGTDSKVITEFIKKKIIKAYHKKKKQKNGHYYFYKGACKAELLDDIKRLGKFFKINEEKYAHIKDSFVLESI